MQARAMLEPDSLGGLAVSGRAGGPHFGSFLLVCSLISASFAKRRALRRAVLTLMATLSASYSCIASAASRARSSFAAIEARCWAFFKVVVIVSPQYRRSIAGFVARQKNPAAGGPDAGLRTHKLCQYIRGQSALAVFAAAYAARR